MDTHRPLFNSKLMKIFLEYIAEKYPEVDIEPVFEYSDITQHEINESGHWFNESQVDRFYMYLVEKTGNTNLARDVGRYIVSARVMGTMKTFVMGLMNTASIYMQIEKSYTVLSKAAIVKAKTIKPNKVEIITTPKPGTDEKPYMCENRTGVFEALSTIFTSKFATIEETSCIHKGDSCCRYVITWENSNFWQWHKLSSYSLLTFIPISAVLFFLIPNFLWTFITIILGLVTVFLFLYSAYLEKEELLRTMKVEGSVAKELLDEMDIRHSNAMMVQEIGQTISNILDVDKILNTVMKAMEKYLNFDCGVIFLYDEINTQLTYSASYGCNDELLKMITRIDFNIKDSKSNLPFITSFKDQKPLMVNNIDQWKEISQRTKEKLIKQIRLKSIVCVPIVYERKSMGLLFASNVDSKRYLTQSDLSLLSGVASEIAISMVNGISFRKLKESEERYRLLAENINDVIWKSDLELNWKYISPSYKKLTGYSQEEAMSMPAGKLVTPSSLEHLSSILKEKLDSFKVGEGDNVSVKSEVEYLCKDGEVVWGEVDASFLLDEQGKPKGIIGVSRNITDRKLAEYEKNVLENQLKQKHKMEAIGTMAGGIAHDFNNILGIILGNTELALDELNLSNPMHPYMFEIKKASLRGKEVVMQLLNFTRKTEHKKQITEIAPIIQESLKLLKVTIPASIKIQSEIDEQPNYIIADPIQVHQVVINLGTNAAQAMIDGRGLLKVKLKEVLSGIEGYPRSQGLASGKYVMLTVSDTGYGIPAENINRIFDPYFTTKGIGKGTGMGLSIVHGIVKNIGGEIFVTSEVGKGTTFEIYLPVSVGQHTEKQKVFSKNAFHGNERILMVDDEEQIVNMGKLLLTRMGYRVTTKTSAIEVLKEFQLHHDTYHLVITDMTMPDITGDRLAEKLMEIKKDIPIIICTGFNEKINKEIANTLGIKAFMMKPIEQKELVKTIRNVLDEM